MHEGTAAEVAGSSTLPNAVEQLDGRLSEDALKLWWKQLESDSSFRPAPPVLDQGLEDVEIELN